jgi:hypothetical protein
VDEVERVMIAPETRPANASPTVRVSFAVLDRLSWAELPVRMKLLPRVLPRAATLAKAVLPDFVVNFLRRRLASE